jgi:transcriptional regulator with XRE-family HTH domain
LSAESITEQADAGEWSPARLGGVVRAARGRLGISVSELGRRSGLSQSFLSAVEAGQSDISIGRLIRVAQALGMRLPDLLEDAAQPGLNVVRVEERAPVPAMQKGLTVSLLAPSIDSSRTFAFCTLAAGAVVEKTLQLRGTEYFVYMLEGEARFELTTGESATLRRGDSVSYPSDDFLSTACVGEDGCSFLWVYSTYGAPLR